MALFTLSAPLASARIAQVHIRETSEAFVFQWRGDESIDITVSKQQGVFQEPIRVQVDSREIAFDGFTAAFNGHKEGFTTRSLKAEKFTNRVVLEHTLEHPHLPSPVPVRVALWMTPKEKALRVKFSYPEGRYHLDRLSIGNHRGKGLEPHRMFLGRMLVMNGPFQPFDIKHNYNLTRYWCFTMANGLTEMIGTDQVPRGFACDPAAGRYDVYTYCDSPITYTFIFTGLGPQEAIAQYRKTLRIPRPYTLHKLPGRIVVMTGYPIRERYEDFLDELTGRGVRDFIWLSYFPTPGDHKIVEKYGGLYAIYDMYTDLFAEGPRKAKGWSPKLVLYTRPGHMMRGYWNSTRLLPNYYVQMAKTRVQGTIGHELENRNFKANAATRFSNLLITQREVKPTALYLDVHSSKTPIHYYDYKGRHYPARNYMKYEKQLFDFARKLLGGAPILSEGNGEAFAGIMDGGIFMDWPTPQDLGIQCADWEYYPFIDQVHRERLLSVGFQMPLTTCDPEEISLATLFGRSHTINAYPGTSQANLGPRAQVYYVISAFHRMLGLSRMERIDFVDDNIHRAIVTYSNGARVWANRSHTDWKVQGYTLPPKGYLVIGPNGFRQYRARIDDKIVEVVQSQDYQYFFCEKLHDFGPLVFGGAFAVRVKSPNRIILYQILPPISSLQIRLGQCVGTHSGQKVARAWALLTRGRRLALPFPHSRQCGDMALISPPEMATVVGYEIEFSAR